LHEIKHDGFRILARRDSAGVRLITRHGNDFTQRFPFIAKAVDELPIRSCLIDGEAIVLGAKEKRQLTPEEQERQKQLDAAYRAAQKKIPDQKAADPWGGVRPTPTASASKKKQQ
jgi:ATP-dependent DNA ligase